MRHIVDSIILTDFSQIYTLYNFSQSVYFVRNFAIDVYSVTGHYKIYISLWQVIIINIYFVINFVEMYTM